MRQEAGKAMEVGAPRRESADDATGRQYYDSCFFSFFIRAKAVHLGIYQNSLFPPDITCRDFLPGEKILQQGETGKENCIP
jgi:hypothetical protein